MKGDATAEVITVADQAEVMVVRELRRLLRHGYGEVVVVVHGARVTMVDVRRKIKVEYGDRAPLDK
jgi:hypothetical protein